MKKCLIIVAVMGLFLPGIAAGQYQETTGSILQATPFPERGLVPVRTPSEATRQAEVDQAAAREAARERMLYGIGAEGAGQSVRPDLLFETETQSRQAPPSDQQQLLYGVGEAALEKDPVQPGTAIYQRDGRTEGRTQSGEGRTTLYGPDGKPVGRLQDQSGTTRVYDQTGRETGRVQKTESGSVIYGPDGRVSGRVQESGGSTQLYGAQGETIGRTQVSGDTTYLYDQQGKQSGRVEKRGDTTYFYGPDGRVQGRKETRGGTTYHYDENGRQTGMTRE